MSNAELTESDRGIDELHALRDARELALGEWRGRLRQLGKRCSEHATAVNRAAEAAGKHIEKRADRGQEKHRRDGELDDVGDVVERHGAHARPSARASELASSCACTGFFRISRTPALAASSEIMAPM